MKHIPNNSMCLIEVMVKYFSICKNYGSLRSKCKFVLIIAILILLGSILLLPALSVVRARSYYDDWSKPVILFETQPKNLITSLNVVPDNVGNIHVFWRVHSRPLGDMEYIYYMRSDGETWTIPVDIVASSHAYSPIAAIDQNGFIHLVWSGPGEALSYIMAHVIESESAGNWSRPEKLNVANIWADIISDTNGTIHLAYAGLDDSGVYYRSYSKNDLNWTLPKNISPAMTAGAGADYVRLAISENGTLHVVWTEFQLPDGWPPTGVYYIRSIDGGESWSNPVEMSGDGHDQINVIALSDEQIHVVWNAMVGVGGRYSRWSNDGGLTWSDIITISPRGFTEGIPQLVNDSDGGLHLLTTFNNCAWYSKWLGQAWSAPECISGEEAMASGWIEEPAMTITSGNRLHAVFWDERKRLWYTTRETSSPTVPVIPFEKNEPIIQTETAAPAVELQPKPVVTHTTDLIDETSPDSELSVGQIVLVSLVPAIVFIGLIAIASLKNYRKY